MLRCPRAASASYEKAARADAIRWWRNRWCVVKSSHSCRAMPAFPYTRMFSDPIITTSDGGMLKKKKLGEPFRLLSAPRCRVRAWRTERRGGIKVQQSRLQPGEKRSTEDLFISQVTDRGSLKEEPRLMGCITVAEISKPRKLWIHHEATSLAFPALTLGYKRH